MFVHADVIHIGTQYGLKLRKVTPKMVLDGQRSCSIVNPKSKIRNPKSARRAAASVQQLNAYRFCVVLATLVSWMILLPNVVELFSASSNYFLFYAKTIFERFRLYNLRIPLNFLRRYFSINLLVVRF